MKTNLITEFGYSLTMLVLILISTIYIGCATVKPTATVIDDETGKPIEGAVAIAIWRGDKEECTFVQGLEGGCWGFKKAEEEFSDKDGNINIEDFWGWHFSGSAYDPRLTVYKFGYVCWDQQDIFIPKYKWTKRSDFNKKHRIVRLVKWPEGFSFHEHSSFMSSVTNGDYSKSVHQLFNKCFDLEREYRIQENIKKYNLSK
jgi:hypothetical protein